MDKSEFEDMNAKLEELNAELEEMNAELEEKNAELEEMNERLTDEVLARLKAEENLQKALQEVQDLYDYSPCGYHSLDKDGIIIRINETELRWLGYTREDVVGKKKFTDFITSKSLASFAANYPDFMKHGWVKDLEFEMIRQDNSQMTVLLSGNAIKDSHGNYLMSRSTVYDITERKKAEEMLVELNLNLERIVFERTNQLQESNAELEETNAMLEEEISERSVTEEALRKSEQLYHSVYENSPLAFGIWDKEYKFVDWNKRAEEIFGWTKEEVLGKRFIEFFVPPEIKEDVTNVALDLLQTDIESKRITANENVTKDGRVLFCEWHNTLLHDGEGNLIGAISLGLDKTETHRAEKVVFEAKEQAEAAYEELCKSNAALKLEISERMDIEEALRKSKFEAEQANLAKSQFLANMSHEIRTPMNGVIGMTELTLITELTEEQRDYLNIIKSSSSALLMVLNDILDYSKIEDGKISLEVLPFDIRSTLHEVIVLFSVGAKQKGLVVNWNFDSQIPPIVLGDSFRLRQVLSNLVGNGVKFTTRGEINLKVNLVEQNEHELKLKFVVADTGIGIAEDKLEKLFQRFSQVDQSSTRQYGGTGLGLAISKMLIEMMNGEISVESKENKGSSFSFTAVFGRHTNDVKCIEVASHEPIVFVNPIMKKVLLAEDDLVSRNMMTIILKKNGFEVLTVENGRDAIAAFKNRKFDLIFMDINMPFMDGYTATSIIRSQEQMLDYYTPIVAMTAYALKGDREKCLEAGMDDYISKPINIGKVVDILRKYIKDEKPERQGLGSNPNLNEIVLALMADSGLNKGISEELVNAFCAQAEGLILGIKETVAKKDLPGIEILLHQLKGSASNVRARQIAQLAIKAEETMKLDFDKVGQVLQEIEDALRTLVVGREEDEND